MTTATSTTKYHLRRTSDGKYGYMDMSDVQPVLRFTNSRVLAYPFLSRDDAAHVNRIYAGNVACEVVPATGG